VRLHFAAPFAVKFGKLLNGGGAADDRLREDGVGLLQTGALLGV